MPTPYNLNVRNSCTECNVRAERIFCNMTDETVATLDAIKVSSLTGFKSSRFKLG